MKVYKIREKDNPLKSLIYISRRHFGYDPERKKFGWHGIFSRDIFFGDTMLGDPVKILETLEKRHRFCLKFPFPAKFRKDVYEKIK